MPVGQELAMGDWDAWRSAVTGNFFMAALMQFMAALIHAWDKKGKGATPGWLHSSA
jgi:hypothetical protein